MAIQLKKCSRYLLFLMVLKDNMIILLLLYMLAEIHMTLHLWVQSYSMLKLGRVICCLILILQLMLLSIIARLWNRMTLDFIHLVLHILCLIIRTLLMEFYLPLLFRSLQTSILVEEEVVANDIATTGFNVIYVPSLNILFIDVFISSMFTLFELQIQEVLHLRVLICVQHSGKLLLNCVLFSSQQKKSYSSPVPLMYTPYISITPHLQLFSSLPQTYSALYPPQIPPAYATPVLYPKDVSYICPHLSAPTVVCSPFTTTINNSTS